MEKENYPIEMEIFIKACGEIIKKKEKENKFIMMDQNILVNGKKIKKKGKVNIVGQLLE